MNPLWVVRKNANKIEEIIPDRQPVGKVQNPTNTISMDQLEEGDCVYLFSDDSKISSVDRMEENTLEET